MLKDCPTSVLGSIFLGCLICFIVISCNRVVLPRLISHTPLYIVYLSSATWFTLVVSLPLLVCIRITDPGILGSPTPKASSQVQDILDKNTSYALITRRIMIPSRDCRFDGKAAKYHHETDEESQAPIVDSEHPKEEVEERYCRTCNLWKPAQCHHCSYCGYCVLRHDHHCPILGACIGLFNQRFFVAFLTATSLGNGAALFSAAAVLYHEVNRLSDVWYGRGLFHIFALLLLSFYCSSVTGFMIYHWLLLCQGASSRDYAHESSNATRTLTPYFYPTELINSSTPDDVFWDLSRRALVTQLLKAPWRLHPRYHGTIMKYRAWIPAFFHRFIEHRALIADVPKTQ